VYRLREKQYQRSLLLIAAAASIIGLVFLSGILWFGKDNENLVVKNKIRSGINKNEGTPSVNKALLTLADGSTIVLDDAKNGAIVTQGNSQIIKLKGKLNYNTLESTNKEIVYNTVSTPHGGQYQVELPDGSKVWLNSTSTLYFPTDFAGKERRVELTGEAYFEIAPNKAMPFVVQVSNAEVRVLGTHFNVMAYKDEAALTTTLLKGSVKFINNHVTNILRPGQQSQLLKDGQVKVVSGVDLDKVVSWKNGIFDFNGVDIGSIGRQLSRWYDVEFVYSTKVEDLFYAELSRNSKLPEVLKALELTGKVHFKIEGRRITVLP
ncbi:MAG: FecR family protein, partial [Segetibacter sp.]